MKKFNFLKIFVLCIFSLTLISCKNTGPILVGYSNTFSPSYGSLATDGMYGAEYAIKEINDSGGVNGRQLELIVRDDEGNPEKAVEIDNELNELGCVAIIGHGLSLTYSAIVENANDNDILLISPTIATHTANAIDDNFIRVIPATTSQGESLASLVMENGSFDTLVILEESNLAFTNSVAQSFKTNLNENGIMISDNNFLQFRRQTDTEYQRIANYIDEHPEIPNILLIASSYDVGSIIQLVNNIQDRQLYLPVWPSTADIFDLSGGDIEGAFSVNYYDINSDEPKYIKLKTDFQTIYDTNPSFSSILAYEAIYVLAEALDIAENYSSESIKSAILEIGTFEGIYGDIHVDEYGDIERQVFKFRLTRESFEPYD